MEAIDIKLKQKRNMKKYLLMRKLRGIKKNSYLMDKDDGDGQKKDQQNKKGNKNRLNSQGSHHNEDQSENEIDDYLYDFEDDDLLQASERRDIYHQFEAQVKPNRPTEIPSSTKILLRYWLYRSRNQKKACNLIGGIIDRNIKQHCQFCGNSWGLTCQPEQNVEDLFLLFLRKINQKNVYTDKQKDGWQDFFQQNCQFRTECLECNQIVSEEYYRKQKENKLLLSQKREVSRKTSRILGDLANPNAYLNFLFDDQNDDDDDADTIFKKRTTNQNFVEDAKSFQINRQNTIISLQQRQSLLQSDIGQEETDDFDMIKNKYSIQNKQNDQADQFQRRYRRQMSLSRFRQSTPTQSYRDSYHDGTKTFLVSNQSTSRMPFFTQQTNELNTNQPSQIEHVNTENEETFGQSIYIGGKNPHQDSQKHLDNFDSRKPSQLLGVSGISQIKQKNFSDFEDQVDDENNNSNRSSNIGKSDEEGKSKLDTARGLVNNLEENQKKKPMKIVGLLTQQNTIDFEKEDDPNRPQNQFYNRNNNAPSRRRLYSETSDDAKLISYNSNNQTQLEIKNPIQQLQQQQQQDEQPQQQQQQQQTSSTIVIRLKLASLCRIWKKLAQARLSHQNVIENEALLTEEL